MKQRNISIDAVKGIAIVLVMIGHVFVHNHMEDSYLYDFIKAVQMPLFMIISGYLCGQGRKISDLKTYGQMLGKRTIAYLVPFFSWLTLKHWDNLLSAYKRIFFQLDFGLWFLAVLFLLTLMVCTAQLAACGFREKKPLLSEAVFWTVYGIICLIWLVMALKGITFLSPGLVLLYVPFYMCGYVVGAYGHRFLCWGTGKPGKLDCKNHWFPRITVSVMAVLFWILVFKYNLNSMETRMDTMIQVTASFLGSAMIIYDVLWMNEGKIKNFFAKLGGYTLEIYVIHYHFANMLNFTDKQYDFYTPEGFGFVVLSFAAMSAVTFVCIWLMKKIRMFDLLFFGKVSRK